MVQNAFWHARSNKLGERVVNSLKKRFFDAYYVETKEEALEKKQVHISVKLCYIPKNL